MLAIAPEEIDVLANAMRLRYGIDLSSYEPIALSRRIARALYKLNCDTVFALWRKILQDEGFVYDFLNELTVGLTELFRNPPLWRFLRDSVLPALPAPMRVWYAGCSTGEEVYTFSILLHEAGRLQESQALATDLNTQSLVVAAQGTYDMSLWEQYAGNHAEFTQPPHRLAEYVRHDTHNFIFRPFLRLRTLFERFDLTRDMPSQSYDIIFCRNVLIYFDDTYKQIVIEKLLQALAPTGFLVLGYYDNAPIALFEKIEAYHAGHKIFRKKY